MVSDFFLLRKLGTFLGWKVVKGEQGVSTPHSLMEEAGLWVGGACSELQGELRLGLMSGNLVQGRLFGPYGGGEGVGVGVCK